MNTPSRRPSWLAVLLGLFILWQLWFLVSSNLGFLLGDNAVRTSLEGPSTHWAQLTGMWQGWAQFSGNIVKQAVYPAFELRWSDGRPSAQITACAAVEPEDPEHFLRLPVHARLGTYEDKLILELWLWTPETIAEKPDDYRQALAAHIRMNALTLRAYLPWRLRKYLEEDPHRSMPDEVVLVVRFHPTPGPGQSQRAAPKILPVLRWRPADTPVRGLLPFEMYDPLPQKFLSIPERE